MIEGHEVFKSDLSALNFQKLVKYSSEGTSKREENLKFPKEVCSYKPGLPVFTYLSLQSRGQWFAMYFPPLVDPGRVDLFLF